MVERPSLVPAVWHALARRPSRALAIGAAVALVAGALAYPLASAPRAGAAGASLPAGTGISVSLDSPADGTVLPPGPVTLTGSASVAKGVGVANTALIYAFDVGAGTRGDAGEFADFCGGQNQIIECEQDYSRELNDAAVGGGGVAKVGAVAYADGSVFADLGPGVGDGDGGTFQPLIAPDADANTNGTHDMNEVIDSVFTAVPGQEGGFVGGFAQFTVSSLNSNVVPKVAPALTQALDLARQAGQPNTIIAFMSDFGEAADSAAVAAALNNVPPNVHIFTESIGSRATCSGTILLMATRTGGTCNAPKTRIGGGGDGNLFEFSNLVTTVQNLLASHLDGLTVSVDGAAATPIPSADITPVTTPFSLPQRGPVTVNYHTTLTGLTPGRHNVCVNALGRDSGGPGSVSDCRSVVLDVPPTVDAGGPYEGLQGAQIPIAGTATDPDSENIATQWSIHAGEGVDNDAVCTFGDDAALSTTVSCNAPGTYALTLTANDGAAQPVSAGTTVTITNVPPTVSAGGPYTGTAGQPVALTGTVTDPDSPGLVTTWSVTPPPGSEPPTDGTTTDGSTTDGSTTDGSTTDGTTTDGTTTEGTTTDGTTTDGTTTDGTTTGDPTGPPPCAFTDPTALSTEINCPTPGTYTLTLTVNDGDNPPVDATTTLTIVPARVPVGSLSLGGQITPRVAYVGGDPVVLTYTVRNDGEIPMAGIRLATSLPAALAPAATTPAVLTPAGGPACLAGGTCDLGTLQPGQRRTVRFVLRPGTKADARIDATLTTTGADSNGADNKASVRVLVRQPELTVDPTTGPPGLVVHASGQNFPAGAIIKLTWSVGGTQLPGQLVVGRDGTFNAQELVFNHDEAGPRVLVATVVRGPRFGPVESSSFLVATRGQEPPFDSDN